MSSLPTPNTLDKVRLREGNDNLKSYFNKLAKENTKEAINLINDNNLNFTSLFVLKSELKEPELMDNLNLRNKIALEFIDEILEGERRTWVSKNISSDYAQIVYSMLKWVFETGFLDDGLSNDFDEILDMTAILLSKLYKEQKILPAVVDMIFKRNRNDYLIHDLVWAFFESRNPNSLVMIANKLLSTEKKDVQLASKLLSFIPGLEKTSDLNNQKKYIAFLNWIEENSLFLHFTGQSLQQKSRPTLYVIVLEAKYLCKFVSVDTGETLISLSQREKNLLDEFKNLDLDTKILLSNVSFKMHQENIDRWDRWMKYPISEQIKMAKSMTGGE
ncbi:hypothetical protein R9X47_13540 [Wukongibacter baidiensis]|uniref:hypothetical protein n=1 Tax=Wukongibacter baidiensis TaxID=1723361 RepID=UPI003D7F7C8E